MAETSAIDEFQDLDYARRRDRDFFETRARQRQTTSDYVSSGAFSVTTRDDDDHSFHGVVCDVELTAGVPIEYLEVTGVAVRGALGATKVLTAPGGFAPSPDASDRLEMRKHVRRADDFSDESRRRRGCRVDSPRRRVAPPRLPRG